MNFLNERKGLTLVEILISVVILGVIIFSFISLFGTGFSNIYSMGGKDRAMAKASDIMEVLYKNQPPAGFDNKDQILDIAATFNNNINIEIEEGFYPINNGELNPGFLVHIEVPFQLSGQRDNVILTTFLRGSGGNDG